MDEPRTWYRATLKVSHPFLAIPVGTDMLFSLSQRNKNLLFLAFIVFDGGADSSRNMMHCKIYAIPIKVAMTILDMPQDAKGQFLPRKETDDRFITYLNTLDIENFKNSSHQILLVK